MFFPDGQIVPQARLYDPLAGYVFDVQQVVVGLLGGQRLGFGGPEGPGRFAVGCLRRYGDQFFLGVTQGGKLPPENAAGIDVDGAVEPLGLRYGGMAVDHPCLPTVFRRPVVADRQPVFIRLPGRFPVGAEGPDGPGAPALHLFAQSGVGHYQFAVVEYVVTDQPVEKVTYVVTEAGRFPLQLLEGLFQAVVDGNLLPAEFALQFQVVVAGHAPGYAVLHHAHDQAEHPGRIRPAVDQVAQENRLSALRVADLPTEVPFPLRYAAEYVPKFLEQGHGFPEAAVDVTDDVEGPVDVLLVVVQFIPPDLRDGRHFFRAIEYVDFAKPFFSEAPQRTLKLQVLVPQNVATEVAVRTTGVAFRADVLRKIEDDGSRENVVFLGQLEEGFARLGLYVGGVDHREQAVLQPFPYGEIEQIEGVRGSALVVFVVGDPGPAGIGRDGFVGPEMLPGKGALSGPGRADE